MGPAHPCVRVVLHLCDHRVPLIIHQHRRLRIGSILSHPRLRNNRPYPPLRKIRRRQGQGRGGTREVKQNHYDKIFPWAKVNTCGPFLFPLTGQCASRLGIMRFAQFPITMSCRNDLGSMRFAPSPIIKHLLKVILGK